MLLFANKIIQFSFVNRPIQLLKTRFALLALLLFLTNNQINLKMSFQNIISVNKPSQYEEAYCGVSESIPMDESTNTPIAVLDESTTRPDVWCMVNKKSQPADHLRLPTIDSELGGSVARHMGYLNEIEYSSTFILENVVIHGGRKMDRIYFDSQASLSVVPANDENPETTIVNRRIDGCENVDCHTVLRLDYLPGESGFKCSAKLKGIKAKFNFNNRFTVGLTGAVEMDVTDFKLPADVDVPTNYSKQRQFTYWFITMSYNGVVYTFRVAFRRNVDTCQTECNVECENNVHPFLFAMFFDLIFKYHKTQYVERQNNIYPIVDDLEVKDLNEVQVEMLKTLELVDCVTEAPPAGSVDEAFGEFVKALGVEAFRTYYPDSEQIIKPQPPQFEIRQVAVSEEDLAKLKEVKEKKSKKSKKNKKKDAEKTNNANINNNNNTEGEEAADAKKAKLDETPDSSQEMKVAEEAQQDIKDDNITTTTTTTTTNTDVTIQMEE